MVADLLKPTKQLVNKKSRISNTKKSLFYL